MDGLALCHPVVAAGDVVVARASPGRGAELAPEHPSQQKFAVAWGNDKSMQAIKILFFPRKLFP